jgi:NAD(P)-dependent dehydrogenase (short-subunit alcohol dehydrogenase family)
MKTYSLENSKYGITANSIQLGYFNYGLTERVPQNVIESVKNNIPINRFGKSDELSSLVRLIIFNEYINGATIPLTGGL